MNKKNLKQEYDRIGHTLNAEEKCLECEMKLYLLLK